MRTTQETKITCTRPLRHAAAASGVNLLEIGSVGALLRSKAFPYAIQAALLAFLCTLAYVGWGRTAPAGVSDKLYAKTNLVNLAIWGLFWPGIVWVTVLLGRIWCMVCPLELVSNIFERLAGALGITQRHLGRWLRAGWLVLAGYGLLQVLVAGIHLHRVPAYTSVFLLALVALAAATGLSYRDRAFCRGFCPVALLLRVYGRGGVLAVRPVEANVCSGCKEKACSAPAARRNLDARSCPSLINPSKVTESTDCLICGQCFKSCNHENMGLLLRAPFERSDSRQILPPWPVVLFVLIVSGFVTSEVASEWAAAKTLFLTPVEAIVSYLGAQKFAGWIEGLWTIVVFPVIAWLLLGAGTVLLRGARTIPDAWRLLALPLAVVIAAGQMAKGLAKFASWAGFTPVALQEPDGVRAAVGMAARQLAQPASLLPIQAVSLIGLALIALALIYSIREARISDTRAGFARLWPHFVVAGGFAFTIFGWGFLQ